MQISNVMKQISNVDADIKIAQAAVTEKEKRVAELNAFQTTFLRRN